jgi:integrase
MGIHLRQRKGNAGKVSLYLDIYHKGKRWYEYLDIFIADTKKLSKEDKDKLALAESIRTQREYAMILDKQGGGIPNKKLKDGDFIAYHVSVGETKKSRQWGGSVRALTDFAKGIPVPFPEVTVKWLLEFQKFLLGRVSNNTALHYMLTLSYSLARAERDGVIARNPFMMIRKEEKLKMRKTLPKYLTLEELRLLANAESKVKPEVRAAFLFSCFSGLRWGDMSLLRWLQMKQVTTGDGEGYTALELQIRKTDTPLTVPLPVQAMKILNEQRELQKDGKDFVFPWCSDKPEARIRNKEANVMLKTWAKDAGLTKRLHFHMARHTFATMTLEHGADLYTVSKLLGHSKITTTTIYAKVVDDMKKKAVMGLPTL